MLRIVLLSLIFCLSGYGQRILKGQSKSRFDWERLQPDDFFSYLKWKKSIRNPDGFDPFLDKAYKEVMGKVISCVGRCYLSRGKGMAGVNFLSTIREGDEFETKGDSYAWIFLMDGTLVRVAPSSSMSFKEINIGIKKIFLHVRFNNGLFYWANRSNKYLEISEKFESDPLFLPLQLSQANQIPIADQSDPFSILENKGARSLHYRRSNEWVSKNNIFLKRKFTYSYLVLPNLTLRGSGMAAHIFVSNGDKSFFKVETEAEKAKMMLRGYRNRELTEVENNRWFQVNATGKKWTEKTDQKGMLKIIDFFVKRTPSIFIARELMLRKFSTPLYNTNLSVEKMAKLFGYKLWGNLETKKDTDINLRIKFLDEYVRRTETTLLQESATLFKKDTFLLRRDFSPQFYRLALRSYLGSVSGDHNVSKEIFYKYFVDENFTETQELPE